MWWQILPSGLLITGFMSSAFVIMPMIQFVITGRPTMRGITEGMYFDTQTRLGFKRDLSMFGDHQVSRGLAYIEDDDDEVKS